MTTVERPVAAMSRAEKVALIGWARDTFPELVDRERAQLIGMSLSAYRNLHNDPDGSKQKARREGYKGVCVDCGADTRSNGTSSPSPRCVDCAKPEKVWTAVRVIEAIQRFAAANGRPPTAHDWRRSGRGYPVATNVYRTRAKTSSPFATWADAIEAAGFPRPSRGHWQDETRRSEVLRHAQPNPVMAAVMDDLREGPCRLAWLAAGRNYDSVRKALRKLIARGEAVRVERGVYRRAA